jgi:hypothetical protein
VERASVDNQRYSAIILDPKTWRYLDPYNLESFCPAYRYPAIKIKRMYCTHQLHETETSADQIICCVCRTTTGTPVLEGRDSGNNACAAVRCNVSALAIRYEGRNIISEGQMPEVVTPTVHSRCLGGMDKPYAV